MAITIKDVAKKAGVSIATVSHVIHHTRFVSPELIERVNVAVKELGYYPNMLVGSMRRKQSFTIGLVIPSISNETFSALAEQIQKILFESKYHVIICNTSYDEGIERDAFNTLLMKKIDGLIVIPTTKSVEKVAEIINMGIPIVMVDRMIPGIKIDSVMVDNYTGMYDAAQYLIKLGHRRLGYIDRVYDHSHSIEQKRGYSEALKANGIEFNDHLVVRAGGFEYESGSEAVKKLFEKAKGISAVIAYYDILAIGAMRGLADLKLKVPGDVSLIGCDGMPVTSHMVPRLTTILLPVQKMAQSACKLLLSRIKDTDKGRLKNIILKPELLIRESTAAPRKHG